MPSPLSTVIAVSLCSPLHRVGHFWNLPLAYYLVGSFFLFVHHDKPVGIVLHQSISVKAQMDIGIARTQDTWHPPYLLHRYGYPETLFVQIFYWFRQCARGEAFCSVCKVEERIIGK
ncbi:uncharacterized protein LOC111299436 isoform X3 [Durio zibethinus]|uniref:Uncharacterized protein LOC111299436 isoform X3 n=1 Tax=Durio zibethinus TaxID=66656 RepID=A0A6P5ZC22_DURZI|nr:uncharacterized protein LOC111299436 isoform X3 [Durio zibethinus]